MYKILLSIIILLATGCKPNGVHKTPLSIKADAIYTNAVIWTGEAGKADASIMALDKGRIIFVGDALPTHISSDIILDLKGQFIVPGFMDNHVHFIEGGAALASVDLRDAITPESFKTRIIDYANTQPEGRWVLNGNWDQTLWDGTLPHKDWIDAQTPNIPVYVNRIDGHMALANSAALRKAGISKDTPDPVGGIVMRDPDGQPSGILKGNALNLILAVIPAPSEDELMEQFTLAQDHALSFGITKIHAVTAYPNETTMLDIFQMAKSRGIMKIRAQVSTPIETWETMSHAVKTQGRGGELLKWGGIKGFIDGSLGARTAWMHEPYSDAPNDTGLPLNDPQKLEGWMRNADAAGLELSIHALGDRGIDTVIAQMQSIAGEDIKNRRYRIEHFQHPTHAAIDRLASKGIIAAMQPYHAIDDGRWAQDRIGLERAKTTYAFRSILDAGGILTFGSDWPVAPISPIQGIYAAVTRQTLDGAHPNGWVPDQKISVEDALRAYTVSNAYAFHEEDEAGMISEGKRADFTILSNDPRTIPPADLTKITVVQTVIGGDIVYQRHDKLFEN